MLLNPKFLKCFNRVITLIIHNTDNRMTTKFVLAPGDPLQKVGLRIMVETWEEAAGSTDSGILTPTLF